MSPHEHHEVHEEAALGSIYDARLIKRLLSFLWPYRVKLALSLVVLLAVTGFELVLPHITKEAIDRYITASGRKAVLDRPVPGTLSLAGDTVLVDVSRLSSGDRYLMARWQKQGLAGNTPYYYFKLGDFPRPESVIPVLSAHPGIFSRYGDVVLIKHSDLRQLSPDEILALRDRDFAGIRRIGLLFLGLILLSFGLNFCQVFLVMMVSQRFMHDLRRRVFAKLQVLDMCYFDRNPVGRLVTRATNDVDAVNEAFTSVFSVLLRDVLLTLAILGVLLAYDIKMTMVVLALLPFIALWTVFFRIRARNIYRQIRVRLARLNATLQENISGVRVIQIFRRQAESVRRFNLVNQEYFKSSMQEVLVMSFFRPLVEVISGIGLGLIIYYGGGQVIRQNISLGVLVAFITYLRMFFRPIQELTESYTVLQSAMASSERIFQLLDEPVTIKDIPPASEPERARGRIEFKDVCFEYLPGEPVLKNITFAVAPGEKVALVGSTGSGKTTIINLISRLYDVSSGQILLDGTDIRELGLSRLRSSLGVVMQDVFLFSGDIKGNIRLNKDLSDENVREIARQVHADTFIERLPQKYGQEVKERGVTLSSGERQLLSFARALAFDPPVLVLDEATANIDSATEKLIQDALDILMRGRTSIVIAHRLSTIKHVDRIYVLHKGQIKEVGTHQELLKKRGIYYNLYQLQHGKESE
ncbi:ABC transporter ATP-binding protein [candidate division TA06 bacterium]|nr:ABC transporter ATP-binding protein [candidate division TA06 bacterium]